MGKMVKLSAVCLSDLQNVDNNNPNVLVEQREKIYNCCLTWSRYSLNVNFLCIPS